MWYYTLNNQQVGPVEEAEIKKLVEAGTITHGTLVWTNGMANWLPIAQTPLAGLFGTMPPPVAPPVAAAVYEDPEVATMRKLFMWFWISLIGTLLFGVGLIVAGVLFFIIFYKSWKQIEHEGIRANADQATAGCFIPGWNYYWVFPAFRGLAKEQNNKFDSLNIAMEKMDLRLPTWMIICLFGSAVTFGLSLIAFIVLWVMYTNKVKNGYIAIHQGSK
ncbi:MAG TPA: DUF4339 domain-containing protein [Anaerolineaceae bacterium]|nr:DUF4339 domain-containing protein [Anaerolineaceae bacterium]